MKLFISVVSTAPGERRAVTAAPAGFAFGWGSADKEVVGAQAVDAGTARVDRRGRLGDGPQLSPTAGPMRIVGAPRVVEPVSTPPARRTPVATGVAAAEPDAGAVVARVITDNPESLAFVILLLDVSIRLRPLGYRDGEVRHRTGAAGLQAPSADSSAPALPSPGRAGPSATSAGWRGGCACGGETPRG